MVKNLKKLNRVKGLAMLLQNIDNHTMKTLLQALSTNAIDDICEMFYNIISNPDQIPKKNRNKLKKLLSKHKQACLLISNKEKKCNERRHSLIEQSGTGIITSIVMAAIPLITSLLSK